MTIHVHIERLILEGLPISAHDGPQLQAAVESALGRLLAEGGLAGQLAAGGAFHSLPAALVDLHGAAAGRGGPGPLAAGIAQSIYSALGRPSEPRDK